MDTDHDHDNLFVLALLLFFIVTLFFLLTSIKLPINLSLNPPVLTFGDFSGPVALALLASLLFTPYNFFLIYITLIFICPWFDNLVNILKWSWLWFYHSLRSIPAFTINIRPSQQQEVNHQSLSTWLVSLQEAEGDTATATASSHGEDGLSTEDSASSHEENGLAPADSASSHGEDGLETNMKSKVELRFLIPLMLNLILYLVSNTSNETLFDLSLNDMDTGHNVLLFLVAWLVFFIFIFFFLLTSIKLPINLSLNPPVLTFGDFSGPVALALLASLLFTPYNFFLIYITLIFICPWFDNLVNILKWSWLWFYHSLRPIPAFTINIRPSQQQEVNHQSLSTWLVSLQEAEADTATVPSHGDDGLVTIV